jgi:sirohydrochlorin ferrochelatase
VHGRDTYQHKLGVSDGLIRHRKQPPPSGSERRVHIIPHHARKHHARQEDGCGRTHPVAIRANASAPGSSTPASTLARDATSRVLKRGLGHWTAQLGSQCGVSQDGLWLCVQRLLRYYARYWAAGLLPTQRLVRFSSGSWVSSPALWVPFLFFPFFLPSLAGG